MLLSQFKYFDYLFHIAYIAIVSTKIIYLYKQVILFTSYNERHQGHKLKPNVKIKRIIPIVTMCIIY